MTSTLGQKPAVLRVEGLRAGYGERIVLHDVSFRMDSGEIRAILGTSGCGKSTLLNHVLGLEQPRAGKIWFGEVEWAPQAGPIPPQVLERTGFLFQNGALLSSLPVHANVALPLRLRRPWMTESHVQETVAAKLEQVGLLHAWHRLPGELSGGMRKRAALARAIACEPELLVCDEPSAGLDPVTSRALDDLLLKLRSELGLSILIVTHELDSIRAVADKLLFLQAGHVLFDGSLDAGLSSKIPEVKRFFAREGSPDATGRSPLALVMEPTGVPWN